MELNLTAGDLVTVVGASAAAATIVQFAKMLFNLDAVWVRTLCLVVGLAVVVGTGIAQSGVTDFVTLLLLVLVGMQAGMATFAMFDTARAGFDYKVERRADAETPLIVTPADPEDLP